MLRRKKTTQRNNSLYEVWTLKWRHFYCFIVFYLYKKATKLDFDQAISGLYSSAETQFSQEKRRRKFSRTERAPGMLLLKNRSSTYSNVCPWLKNKTNFVANKRPLSIALLSWSSYTKKFTRKSQLFAVHVWLVQERFLREEFSSKMGPTKSKKSYSSALKCCAYQTAFKMTHRYNTIK